MKTISTCFTFLLLLTGLAANTDICGINLVSGTDGAFAHGERIEFDFEYSTDDPGGIRIFGRPYTNGSLTSGYGGHGSGLNYDEGTFSGWFTINSGVANVDEIRVRVVNADQSEVLREFWIPVNYDFGENGVHDFTYSADKNMASFLHGEQVTIDFDYNITWGEGARIFIRPFTNGALTPGYGASGSPVYNGTGSASANFTINSGTNVKVDHLRVRAVNPDQNILLAEFFVPVNWYWSSVSIKNLSLSGPLYPTNGEDITIGFDYETTEAAGVRIFPRPVTNGSLTPNYGACGSPVFAGTGSDDCDFSITATNQRVDHIRFRAVTPDQTETLLEVFFPVNRFFGNFPLTNVYSCPPAPARLEPGNRVNTHFRYINGTGANARIFPRPMSDGSLSPGYGASGSPAYGTGVGSSQGFFTINGAGVVVDQIRYAIVNEDQSVDIATYFFDGRYVFGTELTTSAASPIAVDRLDWSFGPNPLQSQGVLRITSREQQVISSRLVDAMGRTVTAWNDMRLEASQETQLIINREALNLSNGVYFLHLQGPDYVVTETVLVN